MLIRQRTAYEEIVVLDTGRNAAVVGLVKELELQGSGIVFVRTREHATLLASDLHCPCITSLVAQTERDKVADGLRVGSVRSVVATAVWSTGLDIQEIRWVVWAGEGQAPVGLKQSYGRATRLAEGKISYDIYDICTDGPGTPESLREQAELRREHLLGAGFTVEKRQQTNASSSLGDIVAVQQETQSVEVPQIEPQQLGPYEILGVVVVVSCMLACIINWLYNVVAK